MADLNVGDLLWMVERRGRHDQGQECVVTKIGRKWASIATTGQYPRDAGRIALSDWTIDGGDYTSPGRCFRSQSEYEQRLRLAQEWEVLRTLFRDTHRRPDHLTIEQMQSFRAAVFPRTTNMGEG